MSDVKHFSPSNSGHNILQYSAIPHIYIYTTHGMLIMQESIGGDVVIDGFKLVIYQVTRMYGESKKEKRKV